MKNSDTHFHEIKIDGYEQVLEIKNEKVGLHAIIAIHNTSLGPACGGIRVYPYRSFEQALTDVLRLSKGMTYKGAIAQSGTGGGKSVIIMEKGRQKTTELLHAFAEAINYFHGRYFGGEDMGITLEDLAIIRQKTPYIAGVTLPGSSGDPSLFTARGAFRGIQAVCTKLWKDPSVRGKKIAVQGLGSVGMKLIQHLFWEGAELLVTDTNFHLVEEAEKQWGAKSIPLNKIFEVDCDIFAPCAIGGILNPTTISQLKCKAVAGVANNQLLTDEDATRLANRNILYTPDFVINSGGLINISEEIGKKQYQPARARDRVDHLYNSLLLIFQRAEKEGKNPNEIAIDIANEYIMHTHQPHAL